MNGVGKFYAAAVASGALVFVALIVYAEVDRAVRGWRQRRRSLRRAGYLNTRGLR